MANFGEGGGTPPTLFGAQNGHFLAILSLTAVWKHLAVRLKVEKRPKTLFFPVLLDDVESQSSLGGSGRFLNKQA